MTEPNQRWKRLHPEVVETFQQQIPMGHYGEPEDLGPLAVIGGAMLAVHDRRRACHRRRLYVVVIMGPDACLSSGRDYMFWFLVPFVIFFVVSASLLGRWMIQPINECGGRLRAPTQFMLTDFVWLVLQLQLVLGFRSWVGIEQQRLFAAILGFLMFAAFMLWLFGIGFLSRAGVTQPLRRAIFTVVLMPAARRDDGLAVRGAARHLANGLQPVGRSGDSASRDTSSSRSCG